MPQETSGQATVEFLVSLAFFIPLLIGIPLLAKYSDVKQTNIEASRYAVWERTIWSDPAAKWNDGAREVSKTDQQIRDEMDWRFYGNPMQGLRQNQQTTNPLWKDRKANDLLAVNSNKQRVSLILNEANSGFNNLGVDQFAYKGFPILSGLSTVTSFLNSTIGAITSDCRNLPGVDFSNGMNLGSRGYATSKVTSSVNNHMKGANGTLDFVANAAILSNAWTAPEENIYRQRVGNLVFDETVKCVAAPSRLVSWLPVYREARDAVKVQGPASTSILLSDYK